MADREEAVTPARLCSDCRSELVRQPGQNLMSWSATRRCPDCVRAKLREVWRNKKARAAAKHRAGAEPSIGSAAVLVNRNYARLYGDSRDEAEFIRRFNRREVLLGGAKDEGEDVGIRQPFGMAWLAGCPILVASGEDSE